MSFRKLLMAHFYCTVRGFPQPAGRGGALKLGRLERGTVGRHFADHNHFYM